MSQLDKCLKFKSVRGHKNYCTLHKITPRDVTYFKHSSSCGTIGFCGTSISGKIVDALWKFDFQPSGLWIWDGKWVVDLNLFFVASEEGFGLRELWILD